MEHAQGTLVARRCRSARQPRSPARDDRRKDWTAMRAKLAATVTVFMLVALARGLAQTPDASDHTKSRDFELISVNNAGAQGNNDSDRASISADGRYVAFASLADNLV